eukprot:4217324-Amphidinium_carterae.1
MICGTDASTSCPHWRVIEKHNMPLGYARKIDPHGGVLHKHAAGDSLCGTGCTGVSYLKLEPALSLEPSLFQLLLATLLGGMKHLRSERSGMPLEWAEDGELTVAIH